VAGDVHDHEGGIYRERLARIEEWSQNMDNRMDIVQTDLRSIRKVLDQVNGGKMLILGILAVLGTIASVTVAAIAVVKAFFHG